MMLNRLPKEQIEQLTAAVMAVLAKAPGVEVANAAEARRIFHTMLTENLEKELEIEREVMETLRAHGQQIYEHKADFEEMARKGKAMLAKKKGFIL
jgi:hypothetical protein